MVCGTSSDAGKSHVVTGLCRALRRRGVRVAPFKAQNMALNSYVTPSGHEIGRAQGIQAIAAGVEPEVAMNPILLKPTGERTSQVVVMGRPVAHMDGRQYQAAKAELFPTVMAALSDLRARFDVVICEGAGSPAEINLSDDDLVNLRLASAGRMRAIVVGDIDRGGVFASLYGTVALLAEEQRRLVGGFVVNKLRGDPVLLGTGPRRLEELSGVPTIGVIPYLRDVALDAEDSLSLERRRYEPQGEAVGDPLDVAVVRFPRISNFTDLDALAIEPGVTLRLVDTPGALGDPDLVLLPGTKATVADLEWMTGRGLGRAVTERAGSTTVLGLCGGYQMLGRSICDEVESGRGEVEGLGLLDVETRFGADKLTRQRQGLALGRRVSGYEIRHGRPGRGVGAEAWIRLDDAYGGEDEGGRDEVGSVLGTSLHGVLESDGFRAAFLETVAARREKRFVPAGACFEAARQAQIDRLADVVEAHVDMGAVERLIGEAVPAAVSMPARSGP
jgi:adenosylcobyric acid synthase